MKRVILFILAAAILGLVVAAGVSATGGEDRFMVSPAGQGAFVVLDRFTGEWEHVATRPDAQGRMTVKRGAYGGDIVSEREVSISR